MENSCEELCLIWGQREQDEVYSTSRMIEDYAVHLPAAAANVFIGLRFYFGGEEYQHARPTCSPCQLLAMCPLTLPGSLSLPCTIVENHVQRARDSFVFCSPGGWEEFRALGVPVVLTQHTEHVSSADTLQSLSRASVAFASSCFPSVGLGPCCCMNITNYHQNLWS